MVRKLLPILAVSLLAAACVPPAEYGSVQNSQIDVDRGVWGNQPLVPPSGLVSTKQSDLIGRKVFGANNASFGAVDSVLVDPISGKAQYASVYRNGYNDFVLIPITAMQISPSWITVDASDRQLSSMPHLTAVDMDARYSARTAAAPMPATTLPPAVSGVPPIYGTPAPLPPAEQLQISRRGSVVGWTVVDTYGQMVGSVDSVSIVPGTGEVRYAVVSGPSIGMGYYIVVPAASMQAVNGRVVLNPTLPNWNQSPRYTSDQVQQTYGRLGIIG